jgi:type IV secretion system protein TrbC
LELLLPAFPEEEKHALNRSGSRTNSFRLRAWRELSPDSRASGQEIPFMKLFSRYLRNVRAALPGVATAITVLVLATPAPAQTGTSPWENAVSVLQTAFTSTIARGLSLVAIVVAGLTFAFGEGGSKRVLAGVLFGVGMAIAAVNFLAWLFPGN